MTRSEFADIMEELNTAYGDAKFPLSKRIMDTWKAYLGDHDYASVKNEVREYVESHPFPPAISDIISKVKEDALRRMEEISNSYQIMMGYCSSNDSMSLERFRQICRDDEELSKFIRRYVAQYAHSTDFGIKKSELECLLEKAVRAWDMSRKNA